MAAKISISCLAKCSSNFAKFKENFTKHKIKNVAKIPRNYENKNFAATLCRSGVRGGAGRYSPGTPSALMQIVHYSSSYYYCFPFCHL